MNRILRKNQEFKTFTRQPEKSRNLRPAKCDGCGGIIGGIGMTLMHGKWLCDLCQDKEKRVIL